MDVFSTTDSHIRLLKQQIEATVAKLRNLRLQLQEAEHQAQTARHLSNAYLGGIPAEWIDEALVALQQDVTTDIAQKIRQDGSVEGAPSADTALTEARRRWPLESHEYTRYGRQMIMPEVGLHGQLRLKTARVLIVGVGGLGCPAAAYLAGAGVGQLGLVDGDTVEESNLHRQVAHSTERVGMNKAKSAVEYLRSYVGTPLYRPRMNHASDNYAPSLNPTIIYNPYSFHLTSDKAVHLFEQYDLVLDCTDHPTSRYLISDACVLTGRPLVSASALKTEGQLVILNQHPRPPGDLNGGPCYRCIFPKPPPADSLLSCGEGGILGPVVGVMGALQALEAIKVLAAGITSASNGTLESKSVPPSGVPRANLLMFSAYSSPQFRTVRLRSRRSDCAACGAKATISRQSLAHGSLDYAAFCGARDPVNALAPDSRVSAKEFSRLPADGSNVLIDVRDATQYAICALRGSINIPWTGSAEAWLDRAFSSGVLTDVNRDHYIVCRFGNDSQLAAKAALDHAAWSTQIPIKVKDIKGGFKAWREEVDSSWPDY